MNIQQVKQTINAKENINIVALSMVRQLNESKEPQPWVSHWDNDARVRVTMHQDVMETIKKDPQFSGLALKREEVLPHDDMKESYVRYVVITPTNIEATF